MSNDILKQIKETLDKKVQEKKEEKRNQEQLGWFSVMIDNAVEKLGNIVAGIKIEPPSVSVTVPDVVVPEIKVPDITVNVPEIKLPTFNVPKADPVEIPEIKIPEIRIPEINIPEINVPEAKVTVNIPDVIVPEIKVPDVIMPDKMNVGLSDITRKSPMPVIQVDEKGNPVQQVVGGSGGSRGNVKIAGNNGKIADVIEHDSISTLATCVPDIYKEGTLGALNSTVTMDVHGQGSIIMTVAGTWTGKILFEATIDETYWVNLSVVQPGGGMTRNGVQNDSQNGSYRIVTVGGYTKVRARMSSYTNGTAIIKINSSTPVSGNFVYQLEPSNLNATVYQISGHAWSTYITGANGTIVSNIADVAGNTVGVFESHTGSYNLGASIEQNVIVSNYNSTTSTLGASATFTGLSESTLGVAGIQVSLKTDQNCTVYVDQSPDGNNWDITDTYNYYASIGNFGITVQAINSYLRVRVLNNTSTATTYFRLQTALCPIVEAVPRSLDSNGHLLTSVHTIEDEYGFEVENTPMNEMRVVQPTRLVGANFEGSMLDTRFWTEANSSSATVTQANAQITLDTKVTTSNAAAVVYSNRRARYVSGSSSAFRGIFQLSAGATNNKRRWGVAWGTTMPTAGTPTGITDGAYFQLDGTEFSVNTMKTGTPTKVTSFNGKIGDSYTLNTNAHTYEIYWTNSKVVFSLDGDLLHTVTAPSDTWSDTMGFYIYMDNVNRDDLQTSNTLKCRVASIRRLGQLLTQPTSYYFAPNTTNGTQLKSGAGNLHGLLLGTTTNNMVVTLADSITNSTSVIYQYTATGALSSPVSLDFKGIPFANGLRLFVNTANGECTVIYE